MGFLNHATNNIIIDAVLTDTGREFLSKNDGSFNITKFKLGDDEVDYSIIEQYGIALGKEKIEKNTPIFEAITNEQLAIKYPLITLSNDTTRVLAYPDIVLDGTSSPVQLSSLSSSSEAFKRATIRVKTTINQDEDFDLSNAKIVDDFFKVRVFNKLLKVSNADELFSTKNDIATYGVASPPLTKSNEFIGQVSAEIVISAIDVTTDSSFKYYSLEADRTTIRTQVEIIGNRTNATLIVPVTITSNRLT
jgi:hypothetical protein